MSGISQTPRHAQAAIERRKVPIFLISFNRLTYLQQLVQWLERAGIENIHIIDNCSTYPPLLDYLARSPHTVHHMDSNYGHLVLWESGQFGRIVDHEHFLVSDCDILPDNDCPPDVVDHLFAVLQRYPDVTKVGLSLRIDDIPEHYAMKGQVVQWERSFWRYPLERGRIYDAAIDTTFALYRPGIRPDERRWWRSLRTAPPYCGRHLPWYQNSERLSEEDLYYQRAARADSQWSVTDPVLLKEQNIQLQMQIGKLREEIAQLKRGTQTAEPRSAAWKLRLGRTLDRIGLLGHVRQLVRQIRQLLDREPIRRRHSSTEKKAERP